jgi:argininosuccinate synthase
MAYDPHKLSMERVEDAAFAPADRIGALEMQNLSVTDNRSFLMHHLESVSRLGAASSSLGELLGKPEK